MITKNDARQRVMSCFVDVGFADLASGVAEEAIQLPANSVVVGGFVDVTEAFNSLTSDSLAIGDAGSVGEYAAAIDLKAAGVTALTVTGKENPVITELLATVTSVGTPTAGAFRVVVNYIATNRADFSQG